MENDDCPHCGKQIEMNTSVHDPEEANVVPKDGDAGMCIYCCGIFKFQDGKRIKAELDEFPLFIQGELIRVKQAIEKVKG